jgi:branched-chain amino acid transport system permease protein
VATRSARHRRLVRPEIKNETRLTVIIVIIATLYPVIIGSVYWTQIILLASLYLVAAVGLNILRSEANQISFGHGAVFGAAAYATAMAAGPGELPFALSAVIGLVAGFAVGILLALPSLRVQGYYLGFVTMAGALAFPQLLFVFEDQTEAVTGISVPVLGLADTAFWNISWLTLIILVVTCASVILYAVIRSSRLGRQMRVVGASPEAAVTLGLNPGRLRLTAFVIASVITAIAGVLYIPLIQYVAPGSFELELSVLLYFIVVIGGPGTILGPLLGVAMLYVLPNAVLADVGEYRLLIYGGIAFVIMFLLPEGVVGSMHGLLDRVRPKRAGGAVSLSPVLEAASAQAPHTAPHTSGGEIILDAVHLTRSFGSVKALDGASLRIHAGEIHGIVGPNGSGKTTLLNSLSGLITLDRGTLHFKGQDVTKLAAVHRGRRGMARTFQAPRIFADLSVWENLEVGHRPAKDDWLAAGLAVERDQWDRTLGGTLPHAQQRFLEVIRVLRQQPSILILDEPAAGLSQAERKEFGTLLQAVVMATGASVVIVEHDLELVWQIADTISVVDAGQIVLTGTPADLRNHAGLNQIFTGVQHAAG